MARASSGRRCVSERASRRDALRGLQRHFAGFGLAAPTGCWHLDRVDRQANGHGNGGKQGKDHIL
jgi:hypothetical protein